jgi:hypothetical protein
VDWVRIELRDPVTPTLVIASFQALLQRDGDVVGTNGLAPLRIPVTPGSYNIVVRHRNHLSAMTASPVTLGSGSTTVDFTSAALTTYGTDARKTVGSRMLLWGGNVLRDDRVKYSGSDNDRDLVLLSIGGVIATNTVTGYALEDVNMDGVVKYAGSTNDRDVILQNIGGVVPTQVRIEQLP